MDYKWITFKEGNLKGFTIYTTEEYSKCYTNGNSDKEMIDDLRRSSKNSDIIFDVGAFTGLSSLIFANAVPKGKVFSFEPNPYNRERIKKNYTKNIDLSKKIKVIPVALSNIKGETEMTLSKDIEGPSSTSRINDSHAKINSNNLPDCFFKETVKIDTLDNFIKENKVVPNIIKIDIEGAEHYMLDGARETLQNHKPIIYMEIHSEYCAIKCYEILSHYNYKIDILNEEDDNRIMVKAEYRESNGNFKDNSDSHLEYNMKIICDNLNRKTNELNSEIEKIKEIRKESNTIIIEEYKKEIEILTVKNKEQQEMINNIYNSKSWRVTKPLRKITGSVAKRRKND